MYIWLIEIDSDLAVLLGNKIGASRRGPGWTRSTNFVGLLPWYRGKPSISSVGRTCACYWILLCFLLDFEATTRLNMLRWFMCFLLQSPKPLQEFMKPGREMLSWGDVISRSSLSEIRQWGFLDWHCESCIVKWFLSSPHFLALYSCYFIDHRILLRVTILSSSRSCIV